MTPSAFRRADAGGPANEPPRRSPAWRWALGLVLAFAAAVGVLLVAIRQPAVGTKVASLVLARVHPLPRATANVTGVRGDWFGWLELHDLRVARGDTLIAAVDTLRARYNLGSLLLGRLDVGELSLAHVRVTADARDTTRRAASKSPPLTFEQLLQGRFYAGLPLHVARLDLSRGALGGHAGAPDTGFRVTNVALLAHDLRLGRGFAFHIDSLGARLHPGGGRRDSATFSLAASLAGGKAELSRLRFLGDASDVEGHGVVAVGARDTLANAEVSLRARPLSLADLAGFFPGVPLAGEVSADVDLRGTRRDRLTGHARASLAQGRAGAFTLSEFVLDARMDAGELSATAGARFEGASLSLRASGTPLALEPRYAVDASLSRLPARLPGLPWWEPVAARAHNSLELDVNGTGYAPATVDLRLHSNGDAGTIAAAGTATFDRGLAWDVQQLSFARLDVARIAGLAEPSALNGHITGNGRVERDGRSMAEVALMLSASSFNTMHVHGAELRARWKDAAVTGGLHLDSDAGGVHVGAFALTTAPGGRSLVRDARFDDLDLSRILGQPGLATRLSGSFTAEARDIGRLGTAPQAATADVRVDLSPSTFRGRAIREGTVHASLAGGGVRAEMDVASSAGTAKLAATARPFDHPASARLETLRFDDVDLATWTGAASLHSALSGSLSGEVRALNTSAAHGAATLRLERSHLGGATLDGGELNAELAAGHANVEGALRTQGNALALRGDVTLHAGRTSGRARLNVPLALLAAVAGGDSLPCHGALVADAEFAADSLQPLTARGFVTGSGGIGRSRLDSLAATFHLERGLLRIDTLLARSNVVAVRGGGRVALDTSSGARQSALALHIEARDLSPLQEILHADTLDLASGAIDVTLGGSDSVRTLSARGSLRSLVWEQLRLSGAELAADGTLARDWRPREARTEVSLRQLHGLPVPIREARGQARLEGPRTAFTLFVATDARSSARIAGRATLDSLQTVVTLDTLAVHADTADWRLAQPSRITWSATRLHVEELDLASHGGRLTARGTVDRRGAQDFDLVLHDVGLPGLSAWLGRADLSGRAEGRLSLRGSAADPQAEGQARVSLYTAGQPAGSVVARASWLHHEIRTSGRFASAGDDSVSWDARLPFAATLEPSPPPAAAPKATAAARSAGQPFAGAVNVRVQAHRFPLAALGPLLDPRAVGAPGGTLDIDATLSGDERALAGQGTLAIENGVLPLPTLGVTYRDLELRTGFEGDRLLVRRAGTTSAKGTLEATGDVRFASVTRIEPRLHVKTKKFVFADSPDLKAMATCELDVTGTFAAPVVKGSVTVGGSSLYFTQPDLAAAEGGDDVKLTPADVRMMEETFGYVAPQAPALPLQLYDASDLELAIKMERDNWVRQRVPPKMAVALTGDFKLRKRPHADPELFGRIEPIPNRGYVQQFARSFDITGGEVLLNGAMKDHAVAIHAQFKPESGVESQSSTDVVVKLDVEGTPDHLKLTLSSDPAMSEAEIVNFIATGRSSVASPTATNGTSNSTLLRDIGLSQLTGAAESVAQEAVGLDVLEVRYDPLRGATLVAGRYVDPQLYVGFRSPLDYNQNTSPNSSNTTLNSTAFEVEYAISRWLVFNCQGETSKVRSFFRARRAY